ncbi:MAG: tRNA guanosine(34) transglycosylase Tgt [Planctomycetota bacterium]
MPALEYQLMRRDASSHARLGRVTTPHGAFDTPAFMPVGTQGTVKGLLPGAVAQTGAQIVLANTYHLMLRPGSELVAKMGGLQHWTGWRGPMLTDSGGFQVFSLAKMNRITDDGVTFQSHLDGATIGLTPEHSMRVQEQLGADIIMAFDDCPPAPGSFAGDDGEPDVAAYRDRLDVANDRTLRWLDRCVAAHRGSGRWDEQALFGIVQGGTDLELRSWCAERVMQHDLPGYAVGGVAVGESSEAIRRVVEHTAPLLPGDRPRYLMGVGYERDLVAAVRAGVDMFDCVLPTRNGRNAVAFTPTGPVRLKNARFAEDPGPIDADCDCVACRGDSGGGGFSRSYLRHLFQAGETLGGVLVSLHNLRHFQRLLLDIRGAIRDNAWSDLAERWPVAFREPVS